MSRPENPNEGDFTWPKEVYRPTAWGWCLVGYHTWVFTSDGLWTSWKIDA